MKTRAVETVTSNEELVRMRIFDGDLPPNDAYKALWELERSQHEALWARHREHVARMQEIIEALTQEKA
jgi:hypothetical protein